MGRIVVTIISVIAVAVVLVMNAGAQVDFNLLGWQLESVPVTVIAIGGFVLGVLYSFLFYVANFLSKGQRDRLAARRQKVRSKEQDIKSRDADLKQREKLVDSATTATEAAQEPAPAPRRKLFGSRRTGSAEAGSSSQESSDA